MRIITPGMEERKLYVSFKVAERCNLACDYCYFFYRGDDTYADRPGIISQSTVEATAKFLGDACSDLSIRTVDVAIHGGEPLLVGKKRFRKICESLRAGVSPYAKLNLGIQTNGVLLDRSWIELCAELKVPIGISIDGPRHIHDKHRPDHKGRGSYDKVFKAIELIHGLTAEGVIPGVGALIVVQPYTSAREVYNHVVRDLGIKSIDFMLPKGTWDDYSPEFALAVKRYALEVMDCWLGDDDPSVKIRTMKFVLCPFLSDEAVEIKTRYFANLAETITIRSDGDVSPDDTIPSLGREFSLSGYNVKTSTLKEFYDAPIWQDIRQSVLEPPQKCKDCNWLGYCGGGELVTRYSSKNRFNNPSVHCETYQAMYARAREYVLQWLDADLIDQRIRKSKNLMFEKWVTAIPA